MNPISVAAASSAIYNNNNRSVPTYGPLYFSHYEKMCDWLKDKWVLRDGSNKDQEIIFSEYPRFNNFQEFKTFCEENNKVMSHVLTYLNEISCDIQKVIGSA